MSEGSSRAGNRLLLALGLTAVVLVIELAGGLLSHSLALLSDAGGGINVRAAMLHVVGDIAASVGVVVAGAVILLTGWLFIDPLLSIAIAALIAWGALRIVIQTVDILLESTPRGMKLRDVQSEILSSAGVDGVHDLHVWSLSPEEVALSAHLVLSERSLADAEHLVADLSSRLD